MDKQQQKNERKVKRISGKKWILDQTAFYAMVSGIAISFLYILLVVFVSTGTFDQIYERGTYVFMIIAAVGCIVCSGITLQGKVNLKIGSWVSLLLLTMFWSYFWISLVGWFVALMMIMGRIVPSALVISQSKPSNSPVFPAAGTNQNGTTNQGQAINIDFSSDSNPVAGDVHAAPPKPKPFVKYDDMNDIELKKIAKSKGLVGYEKMSREQLIMALKLI